MRLVQRTMKFFILITAVLTSFIYLYLLFVAMYNMKKQLSDLPWLIDVPTMTSERCMYNK